MEQRRWVNQTQPQTLQIAVFLLYLTAVFSLIDMVRFHKFLVGSYELDPRNVGYVTKETAPDIIAKAYREALALATETGTVTKETAPRIFGKAEAEASALLAKAKEKGFQ